ncbi:MAG: hypothetical protein ACOZB3_10070 [Calditrichota bacterium]
MAGYPRSSNYNLSLMSSLIRQLALLVARSFRRRKNNWPDSSAATTLFIG